MHLIAWLAALCFIAAVDEVRADSYTLTWTAPGDDGFTGTAAAYDLRYSTLPITPYNWNSAIHVNGVPAPHAAGTREAYTVYNLASNTRYYFAIRTVDRAGNWSEISNNASNATCPNGCIGFRGNVDGDPYDDCDISDLVFLVNYMMGDPMGPPPPCPQEADVDGSGDINIADLIYLAEFMYDANGQMPAPCSR